MLKVIFSKFRHRPGRFLLLLLMLLLACAFFCISLQLYMQSIASMEAIEENTTTLAIERLSIQYNDDGSLTIGNGSAVHRSAASRSSAVLSPHPSTTLSGRVKGLIPVVPSALEQAAGVSLGSILNTERFCAFHVRCENISLDERPIGEASVYSFYNAYVTLIDALVMNRNFKMPTKDITVSWTFVNRDGTPVMEEGKEYVIFGTYYYTPPYVSKSLLGKLIVHYDEIYGGYDLTPYNNLGSYDHSDPSKVLSFQGEDGLWRTFTYLDENSYPILELDDPRLDEQLEWAVLNSELLYVTGISTAQGVPLFAMKEAQIVQGRDFTQEESNKGANVCLVSQRFATLNGLELGDEIPVDMYKNNIVEMFGTGAYYRADLYYGDVVPHDSVTYTIVGMYESMEWKENRYCFSPNTIFVPQNSISIRGAEGLSYASSLILQNGSNEQFLSDLRTAGIPENAYILYDGGYMQFMESLQLMKKDTGVFLSVCSLLFLVLSAAGVFMMQQHLRKDSILMTNIGADRRYAYAYETGCILPVTLLAVCLAYGVCVLVHQPLMQTIEAYYALPKPVFSDLPVSMTGMLTTTIAQYPSPLNACIALLGISAMALFAIFRERSTK